MEQNKGRDSMKQAEAVEEDVVETIIVDDSEVTRLPKIDKKKVIKLGIGVAVVVGGLFVLNQLTKKPDIIADIVEEVSEVVGE